MSISQIAFSQESKSLFDSRLQLKVEKLEKNASMRIEVPRCWLDAKLQKLLPRLQRSIVEQIKMLKNDPQTAYPNSPPFCWLRECVKLQNFYSSLRNLPKADLPVGACIEIRMEADEKVNNLLSSQNSLSHEERELMQREILADAWSRIGRIAFHLEKKTEDLDVTLKEVWKSLLMRSKAADAHALQPVGQVYDALLSKEIARLLLTSQGQLNLGIIKSIKERFFPETKVLTECEKGIVFVLDRIDSSWQKSFDEIQEPCNAAIPSNALIRAELDLLPNETITKLHCQQVALAALLSLMTNKQVSECVTMAWMLKRLPEFFLASLQDYTELIYQGRLTRKIEGKRDVFFFENAFEDASLFQKITLKRNKVIEFSGAPFWKCPQLISACRQMGIEDLEARREMLLNQLAPSENGENQVTWDKLIRSCAKSVKNSQHNTEELIALGRYSFSLSVNRLLKAWEACLAGTVDQLSDFSIRTSINETVMSVFSGIFKMKASHYEGAMIKERKSDLKKLLNKCFRLVYNEAIPLTYAFDDGRYTCGGFKLHQRDLSDLTRKGTHIETPIQFQTFILGAINTFSAAEIDALQDCVLQNDFVKKVICHYDVRNATVSDPVKKYDRLGQTPMTSLCADYCPDHLTIDSADYFNPDIRAVFLKNSDGLFKLSKPRELLKWMLGLSQFSKELFYSELFATGEELQDFLFSKMGAEEWIQETLIEPGLIISQAKMEDASKLKYQKRVREFLGEQNPGRTPRSIGRMEAFFKEMNTEMTVQQFAQRSYDGLLNIFKHEVGLAKAMELMLDSFLLESLSDDKLHAIQESAVRFAEIEGSPLFFCCFFNPRTELLDLGSANQDKTSLKPIGMHEWQEKGKK